MRNRDNEIDVAKGIAIYLVVLGHIIQYTIAPMKEDFFLNPIFQIIYSFHMPLFMFISGYLANYSLKKRSLKLNLYNKVESLLMPYIVWTIITILIVVITNLIIKNTFSLLEFLMLIISNLIVYPNIWFLYVLFIFYCSLFLTIYLDEKIGKLAFLVIPVIISLIPFESYFGTHYIQFFYLFFLIGYLTNRYKIKNKEKKWEKIKS